MDFRQFDTLTNLARTIARRWTTALPLGLGLLCLVAGVTLWLGGAGVTNAEAPVPQLRQFTLVAEEFDWEIMPGVTVRAWGYNGQMPGPELRVREGDQVRITLVNHLPVETTIHWHGIDVPPAMDGPVGLNQAGVEPGQDFVYEFTATNPGSRWYHAHASPKLQVALGLYGSLVVEPRQPERTYDREFTYMLSEWDLELTPGVAMGTSPIGPGDATLRGGELGTDLFLMNGRAHESVPPIKIAEGERVLVRLTNAGNLPHAIHTHGHSFKIVATDGNDVPEAARLTKDTVLIGPGERYDLELEGTNPGVWMFHCHMENHADNGMMGLIEYDGATPTGPVAAYFGVATGGHTGHHQGGDPATTVDPPPTIAAEPTAWSTVPASATASPKEAVIEIGVVDDRFEPSILTVVAGTTVTFVNRGSNWHSVAAFDGSFESGRIEPGGSFAIRFDTPGEYQFICRHHGLRGMTGTITVR